MKTRVFAVYAVIFLFCGIVNAGINDGLVAYYPFNGNANDESGNGNNAKVYGATLTSDRSGNSGSAYLLSGNSGYYGSGIRIEIPCMIQSLTNMSVSLWARIDSFSVASEAIIWFGNSSGAIGIIASADQPQKLIIYDNNTQSWLATGKGAYAPTSDFIGYFRHYVMVIDGVNGIVRGYYDGTKVAEYSVAPGKVNVGGDTSCAIGKHWWGNNSEQSSDRINGVFDDVRIYNRTLSDSEVQKLYQGQSSCSDDIVVKPYTFTAGTPAKASEINANFDAIFQRINTPRCTN